MTNIKKTNNYKYNKESVKQSNNTAYKQDDREEFKKTIILLSKR